MNMFPRTARQLRRLLLVPREIRLRLGVISPAWRDAGPLRRLRLLRLVATMKSGGGR